MTSVTARLGEGGRGDRPRRPSPGWRFERCTGRAGPLHDRALPGTPARTVSVLQVERPALVLGSAQSDADADPAACRAAGVEVVRRHSGGGAVLVDPESVLWVDVVLPAGDPLWDGDVGRSFGWLGDAWAAALGAVVPAAAIGVHRGTLVAGEWSRRACFAGLGPGEVTVDGRKAVGLSQRRTRAGARFQCAVHVAGDGGARPVDLGAVADLLALGAEERRAARAHLARFSVALPTSAARLVSSLRAALP